MRLIATVAVAFSVTVKSPVALSKVRVANEESPASIVSAPDVELNLTVPLLAAKVALLSNDPWTLRTPVGYTTSPPRS